MRNLSNMNYFCDILLELIRKVVTCCNFNNQQYVKPEQIAGYYTSIVIFQHALLTFWIGS